MRVTKKRPLGTGNPLHRRGIGGDAVGHKVGQDDLEPVQITAVHHDIAVVDRDQQRTYDERNFNSLNNNCPAYTCLPEFFFRKNQALTPDKYLKS